MFLLYLYWNVTASQIIQELIDLECFLYNSILFPDYCTYTCYISTESLKFWQ